MLNFKRIRAGHIGLINIKGILPNSSKNPNAIIAMNGEPGWQVDYLLPGLSKSIPLFAEVEEVPMIEIPPGEIGLIVAHDGKSLDKGQILGYEIDCEDFENPRKFMELNGQKGKQLGILANGTYKIHTKLFTVVTTRNCNRFGLVPNELREINISPQHIGIVTTLIGKPLPPGDIAAPITQGHENFQDATAFLRNGGYKGLQEEVLVGGPWRINPWFAQVEEIPMTYIKKGTVGVVHSSVGKIDPLNGNSDLVENGYRGTWKDPYDSGWHPINTKVHSVFIVPTHQIELEWTNRGGKSKNDYDANLKALKLHSKDTFEFDLELTQKIQVNKEAAPLMINKIFAEGSDEENSGEKYGTIRGLINRALEPAISSHFRIAAQSHNILDFQEKRGDIQREAEDHIRNALNKIGVDAVGTHINEVSLPPDLVEHSRSKAKKKEEIEVKDLDMIIAEKEQEISKIKSDAEAYAIHVKEKAIAEAYGSVENYLKRLFIDQIPHFKVPTISINSDEGRGMMDTFTGLLLGSQMGDSSLQIKLQELLQSEDDSEYKKTRLIEFMSSNMDVDQIQNAISEMKKLGDGNS